MAFFKGFLTHERPIDNCWSPRFFLTKHNTKRYKTLDEFDMLRIYQV